jgi:hypothetical protein
MIKDCDMPEDWKVPLSRQENKDDVDVMSFLHLKRAGTVGTTKKEDDKESSSD